MRIAGCLVMVVAVAMFGLGYLAIGISTSPWGSGRNTASFELLIGASALLFVFGIVMLCLRPSTSGRQQEKPTSSDDAAQSDES